jgi:hypothetical protein
MRSARVLLSFGLCVSLVIPLTAQQTASSSTQASQLLQRSLAALQGNTPLTDVTLSGTARRIAGSDEDSGTGILKAIAGAARMDLSFSAGRRSEVTNLTGATPAGSWSATDGIAHAMSFHNLLTEPAWFFPAFAISRRLSTTGYVVTYVGHETRNGQSVEHVSVSQTPAFTDPPGAATIAHLTQVDFFLDASTFLPAAIAFNIHPDNNALLDIPVEIRFSDYRAVNGAQVPHHVQKFLNNSLILDFQADSVALNSGLSSVDFAVAGLQTGVAPPPVSFSAHTQSASGVTP